MKFNWFTLCILLVTVQYSLGSPFDFGGWFKNQTKKAGDWIQGAVNSTKDWVEGAVNDTKDWVEGAAKDTENWFKGAARDTENWFKGAARDTESWVKTAAKDVEREFNKAGKSINDFFNQVGVEVTRAFNVMKYKWDKFEKDASNFFKKSGEGIKKAIADIKKRIDETKESAVKIIFEKIYEGLHEARNKLEDLSIAADVKFENAMVEVKEMLFSVTSQIQNFMNRMKLIIDTKKDQKRGMLILDSYLKESTQMVYSCSDAAVNPIRELYDATKSLVGKTVDKLEEFIKDIEGCLNKGVSIDTVKCGKNLGKIAKSALKEMGSELVNMKVQLVSTAISEVSNLVCISKTRIDVELNKSKVEIAIRNLQ